MIGVVAERYIADGVLVTQQMVDAGIVNRWMLARDAPEYSATLDYQRPCAPGLEQHQQQMAERQTAATDCLTQLRQMRMQRH